MSAKRTALIKHSFLPQMIFKENSRIFYLVLKKLINNSRGKYKRNECLINVCKSDTDLS
jgi:hypothetical protein